MKRAHTHTQRAHSVKAGYVI